MLHDGIYIKNRKGKVFMLQELEDKIGYHFKDKKYLKTALTHSSYANENKKSRPKQRAFGIFG